MHKDFNKICFNSKFSEPIIVSGKVFSLRILSSYDFIIFMKRYHRLLKYLFNQKNNFHLCKNIIEKASLVSMCLYIPSTNSRLFPSAEATLKALNPFELKYIYNQYVKLSAKALHYNKKMINIFERVKKHGYQQILQENKR